ncbi:MAG: uncharacterized protein QG597_2484 [Actinomycetota bacterium]|nr:uncharacterized protein [Actinomycetota bacterium]
MSFSATSYETVVDGSPIILDGDTLTLYHGDTSGPSEVIHQSHPTSFESSQETTHYFRSLALILNNSCNLACKYCYAEQGGYDMPGRRMSPQTAHMGIDRLIGSVRQNRGESLTVGFFGGEPILSFDLIEDTLDYARKQVPRDIRTTYLLTTNGTALREDHVKTLEENAVRTTLSIDGNQAAHDSNRVFANGRGSYAQTVRAIHLLQGRVPIQARITVSSGNVDIQDSITSILAIGLRRITFAVDSGISDADFETYLRSLDCFFVKYASDIKNGTYYDVTNITQPMLSIAMHKKKRAHCNAGVAYLALSADGQFYRCHRFTGHKEQSLGRSSSVTGVTIRASRQERLNNLGESAASRSTDCAACPFVYLCGGICFHEALLSTGSEFKTIPRECRHRRTIYQGVVRLLGGMTSQQRRDWLLSLRQLWTNENREEVISR